jgi:hypothetical protein
MPLSAVPVSAPRASERVTDLDIAPGFLRFLSQLNRAGYTRRSFAVHTTRARLHSAVICTSHGNIFLRSASFVDDKEKEVKFAVFLFDAKSGGRGV